MAKLLNLSVNELWSLFTRTFEALYGHERDYYDMARTVLWLECNGHDGVQQLVDALPVLEKTNLSEPSLTEKSPSHVVVDAKGHSLLCIGRSIADLAMAYASVTDTARLDIVNVVDSKSLIGVLSYIASENFSAVIFSKSLQATISSCEKHPIIYAGNEFAMVSLICSKTDNAMTKPSGLSLKVLKDKESQKNVYSLGLEEGINIQRSHYDVLNVIANRVLVEATEASRRGAGE